LQVIGPTKGAASTGGVTVGGVIPVCPGGVEVVVVGLNNVPVCGEVDGGVVTPYPTSGLFAGGLPPLGEGLLLLPDDVSEYTILPEKFLNHICP